MTDHDNHTPPATAEKPAKRGLKLSSVTGGRALRGRASGSARKGGKAPVKISMVAPSPAEASAKAGPRQTPEKHASASQASMTAGVPPAPKDEIAPHKSDAAPPPEAARKEDTIATVSPAAVTDPSAQDTAPDPEDSVPYHDRIKARAHLMCRLASLRGVTLAPQDLVEQLQASGATSLRPEAMMSALISSGLKARVQQVKRPTARTWPAIAIMQGGQPVLVLSQGKAGVTIYDTSCPDNRAEVPMQDFMPFFTGQVLTVRATLAQLTQRHTPQLDTSHWFWGEFPKYRRQISEIMLGSLVANVLAVAVALFSLQVYDRVVPHQSQATLWVLAIGALMAIGMEGLLKLARPASPTPPDARSTWPCSIS